MSFVKLVSNLKEAKINEVLIINIILKNSKKILFNNITLSQISEQCHISHSSVSRLIKKYGWNSWQGFVQSCIVEDVISKELNSGIMRKLELQRNFLENHLTEHSSSINKIISSIKKTKVLLTFGERISGNLAQYFSFILARKSIMVTHFFFEHELVPFCNDQALLMILVTTNRTNYQQLIDQAVSKKTKVIVLNASETPVNYQNALLNVNLPLITYIKNDDAMFFMKSESLRQVGIKIFENI